MHRLPPALLALSAAVARTALVGLIVLLAALILLVSAPPAPSRAEAQPAGIALERPAALP